MKPHSHRKPASSVRSTLRFSGALLTSLLLIRAAGPAPASDLTLVRNFTGMNGAGPQPTLTLAADGNFYGVTHAGGNGAGTVFKRPAVYGAPQTTLYAFAADGSDGAAPNGVILGQDGALYGTTAFGGAYGNGAVFKLSLSGTLTLLHAFHPVSGTRRTNSDGAHPFAALVQASDGALYGTTEAGGAHGLGVVFRITPGGVFTRLHAFASEEGAFPCAPLLQAGDGDFYGTTRDGGASGAGTLFKMSAAGSVTVLHAFQGGQDGAYPRAGVIQGPDGALYGTTPVGGAANSGTVYRVTLSGTATVLYAFSGGTDGAAPQAGLLLGSDGSFYGTTQRGGYGYGTLFRLTPAGALTSLYTFTPPDTSGASFDGARPSAGLVQTADGFLWGTTPQGGENGTGTFFAIQPTGGLIDIQQTFPPADGANPVGGLIQAGDGNLYGAASFGGANNSGVIFQLTASGAYTEIYSFSELDAEGLNAEGAHPMAALLQGTDGYLFGTTAAGGSSGAGTVFRITTQGVLQTLHLFTGADGAGPAAPLIQGRDGNFYGTTQGGGANGQGTLFQITPAGSLTTLHVFSGRDGALPNGLIQGRDGGFYGTTQGGGAHDSGAVFRWTPAAGLKSLTSFAATDSAGTNAGGAFPSSLIEGSDGAFYGATQSGGVNGNGTVFKITRGRVLTTLHTFAAGFPEEPNPDGEFPAAPLILGADGNFYGKTSTGGPNGTGTVFRITPSGVLTTLSAFAPAVDNYLNADGAGQMAAMGALLLGSDGKLYGAAPLGGTSDAGTIFALTP